MHLRTLALAGISGVAAFVLVGVLVTELAASAIEFSLFVGIPAGLVAGVAVALVVAARLEDPLPARRRPALAVAAFGVAFVLALPLGNVLLGLPNTTAILGATALGAIAAGATYVTGNRTESRL